MSATPHRDDPQPPTVSTRSPTVFVVDDDESFSASITRLLQIAGYPSRRFGSVEAFLFAQATDGPGCILLDISMPGPSGIDMFDAISGRELAPPIIFVTGRDDVTTTVSVMRSGALDYLVKPVGTERLLGSVRKALQIDAERRAIANEIIALRSRFTTLSAVERAIFEGVVRDRLNKQLAAELGVCERTVKAQRARMMEKLGLPTVPDLVRASALLSRAASQASARVSRTSCVASERDSASLIHH